MAQLNMKSDEALILPFGFVLDLIECHFQFIGVKKHKNEADLDMIIPF